MSSHELIVRDLVMRVGSPVVGATILTFDEMSHWPAGLRRSMLDAKWITEVEPALTTLCDGCDEGHWEEPVQIDDTFDFIACPSAGRVAVRSERRRQWSVEPAGVVRWCSLRLGLRAQPESLIAGRLWRLGRFLTAGAGWSVFAFLSGTSEELATIEGEIRRYRDPLVLLLGTTTVDLHVPTIDLQDLLAFDEASGLAIDRIGIEERCASFAPAVAERPIASAANRWTLSADFRTARCSQERLDLTPNQARVVEIFHRQMLLGDEDLSQHYVLQEAEVESDSLYQVFRGSAAWKRLILPCSGKGMFRLNVAPPQIHR